jgi:hypothetical protein
MNCNLTLKDKSIQALKKVGATEDLRRIVDEEKFHDFNKRATERAYSKYGVGDGKTTMLFSIDYGSYNDIERRSVFVKRAKPDNKMFEMLQDAWDNRTVFKQIESETYDPVKDFEDFMDLHTFDEVSPEDRFDMKSAPTGTENESILFGDETKSEYTVQEVLDNLSKNFPSRYQEQWLNKIKELSAKNIKAKVVTVPTDNSQGTFMSYSAETNTIQIPLAAINEGSAYKTAKSFLHEVVHAVTVNMYNNQATMGAKMFKTSIDEAFDYYTSNSPNSTSYGFTNVYEFMAEIYSNPAFIQELKSIDEGKSKKNLFERIIEAISRLIGFSGTELSKAEEISKLIIEQGVEEEYESKLVDSIESSTSWGSNIYFTKKDTKGAKLYTDLTTIEGKIDKALVNIDKSLKSQISRFKAMKALSKSDNFKKYTAGQIDKLSELKDEIVANTTITQDMQKETALNQASAITQFVKHVLGTAEHIEQKIEDLADKDNRNQYFKQNVESYNDYLASLTVITDINDVVAQIKTEGSDIFTKEELKTILNSLEAANGKLTILTKGMNNLKKDFYREHFNNIRFFPEVETEFREKAVREWRDLGKKGSKEEFVAGRLSTKYADDIQEALDKKITEVVENPMFDISVGERLMYTPINVSNTLVQVMNQVFMDMENERLEIERPMDKKFAELHAKLVEEKGTSSPGKLYENIVDYDHKGKPFLQSEYSAKVLEYETEKYQGTKEINKKLKELEERLVEIEDTEDEDTERDSILKEILKLDGEKILIISKIQDKYFDEMKGGDSVIKNKFLNTTKRSKTEQEVLDFFKEIITSGQGGMFFGQPKLSRGFKADHKSKKALTTFYKLPAISKSGLERLLSGDIKRGLQYSKEKLTKDQADDIEYTNQTIDFEGQIIRDLKLHYRESSSAKMNPKDQSIDLFTLFRLEFKNQNAFKIKKKHKASLEFMLDIAKDASFYQGEGSALNRDNVTGKLQVTKNDQSQVFKLMTHMMESKFYNMSTKNRIKWGKYDAHKAVNLLNAANSFLTMSLNVASGTANVLNGSAQLFLESFFKGHFIKSKSIAKAQKLYSLHMFDALKDTKNPINTSFLNQMAEMFDIEGNFNFSEADFLKSTYAKSHLNSSMLQVMQNSGEHWLQSMITMSVLDGIKVKNKAHRFIDAKGNEVSEKKAASLLDMMEKDDQGILQVSDKVVFTTHSKLTEWNKGGKTKIDALIHKKLYDMAGDYRAKDQPEVQRHALGKLTMLYRKYLVPMGVARLRGISSAVTHRDNLTEKELNFSYALQEYEEGTYVSLIRYIKTVLTDQKRDLTGLTNWNSLSDYERHNIGRAVKELVIAWGVLPLATMLIGAAADDADDEVLFFIAYQLRRLQTEISAYHNPSETFKMLKSPIPSLRLLETTIDIIGSVLNPWEWSEKYESGHLKGRNKLATKIQKQFPGTKGALRRWEDLFRYQSQGGMN